MTARTLGGRYSVGDLLGRGGMADVHLGVDTRLGRPVAIKMLRADLSRDVSFLARFRREAESAAGLNHPNIVGIFDSGEDLSVDASGREHRVPFIIMELVQGETLRQKLSAHGPYSPDEAARLTQKVLSALDYSHSRGIIHRDIKPANVMITPDGEIKVMDFGIARAIADSAATMTQTSAVVGTAQYLSPEQAQGLSVDARADLYSTGCMLFELLTGRPPFVGDSPVAIAYQHVSEAPTLPSLVRLGIPSSLDAIVVHALEKPAAARYQTAEAFRADLGQARSGMPVSAGALASLEALTGGATAVVPRVAPPVEPEPDTTLLAPVASNEESPRGRRGVIGIVVGLLLALGLGAFAATQLLREPDAPTVTTVPFVIGLPEESAVKVLEDRGLVVQVDPVQTSSFPVGSVSDQDPKRDAEVQIGSTVTVSVVAPPEDVEVPDVEGYTEAEARTALEGVGLTLAGVVKVDDKAQKKGRVIETDPSIGEVVKLGSGVQLRIATGKVVVPDLLFKDINVAISLLQAEDLELATPTYVDTDSRAPGQVLEQSPAPGETANVGSRVKVKVARAPTPTATATVTLTPTPEPSG